MGDPVNIYAPNANPYAQPPSDGTVRSGRVRGAVWLLTGQPGQSNVAVHLGDQGVFVIDSGTQAMAPALLAEIQRLGRAGGGLHPDIRMIVNTNGRADHVGGNEVIRKAGNQIISGEEAAQQSAFGSGGAQVFGHENMLSRLVTESTKGGLGSNFWPSDTEGFEIDNRRFNAEPVQIYHPASANTDGQLILLFRQSDVIIAGDVVDMTGYPIIDTTRGGTIDGELTALNRVIDMAVPGNQADGGTLIVPGHGRLCDQADVVLYKNMLTVIRNTVQFYKNQGKSLDEVLALKLTEGYDQRWGNGPSSPRDFVTAVYQTLPAKGPVFFSVTEAK